MWPKIYKVYSQKVFPKIKDKRGATRLLSILKRNAYRGLSEIDEEPIPLKELDYDNIIILDACRFDLYKEVTGCENYRISTGSSSKDSIKSNFSENDWRDTVLITANPHFHESQFEEVTGRELEDVFHTVFKTFETGWDKDKGTVPPEKVSKDAITAQKLFPDKKKIIWYMQPHRPFIGSKIQDYRAKLGENAQIQYRTEDIFKLAERGEYDQEEMWSAYKQTLELVLKDIEDLNDKLTGETLVTSDHGNVMGESGLYGHPPNLDTESIRKVPLDTELKLE